MYQRSAAEKPRKDSAAFLYPEREKVSIQELSDDFGTAHGPFLLVGETVVSRQPEVLLRTCVSLPQTEKRPVSQGGEKRSVSFFDANEESLRKKVIRKR